jgi:hypothetical protein
MQYFRVLFDDGESLLQEVYAGQVLRYCDDLGNTVLPPMGGAQNVGAVTPTFTPPPDPVPDATPAPAAAPVEAPVTPVATNYTDILGAPLRTMTYDDKGQIVRIDYPGSGTYQMIEYSDGRLRKITEISPIGVCFERHFYYDNWGRFCEETQL